MIFKIRFRQSNVANAKLSNLQDIAGKQRLRLLQYVPTRWNSRLAMIARLIEVKDELVLAQSHLANAPRFLTAEDWQVLQEVSLISSPLNTMITVLSGEEYVTASQIIPLVHGVYLKLINLNDNLTTDTAKLYLTSIKESIEKRLFPYETRTVTKLATFFDPRFKKLAFQSPQRAEEARAMATSEIQCFLKKQEEKAVQTVQPGAGCSSWGAGLLDFMEEKLKNQRPSSAAIDATICVCQYVENQCMPQTTNPIEYWCQENRTTGLRDVAKWYMSIPASSVPAERIFSKAGQIISDRRNSLNPETARKLIFLSGNKKYL